MNISELIDTNDVQSVIRENLAYLFGNSLEE